MPETLKVTCANCGAEYDLPPEYAGQEAECSACGTVFVIPVCEEPEPVTEPEVETDTSSVHKMTEDEQTATNTVKLSRSKLGMVPSLKDETYKIGVVQKPTHISDTATQIDPPKHISKHKPAEDPTTDTSARVDLNKNKGLPLAPKKHKKWWQFWK